MTAVRWKDSKSIYFLATGASTKEASVTRNCRTNMGWAKTAIVCPQIVQDYQSYMKGVDNHDQLRLQRYFSHILKNRYQFTSNIHRLCSSL